MDETEGDSGKLMTKMKNDPLVPLGVAGLTGVVAYSLYNLKKRKQKLSLYLIHTRILAQGTLMTCLTLGLVYTLIKNNMNKLFPEKKQ